MVFDAQQHDVAAPTTTTTTSIQLKWQLAKCATHHFLQCKNGKRSNEWQRKKALHVAAGDGSVESDRHF